MKIFVLSGPNLNMLGKRDASFYGSLTLSELESKLQESFPKHSFAFFQSNHEGELIDVIHKEVEEKKFDGYLVNFGGLSHSSVALRDAVELLKNTVIEVHLSNIHAREEFRHHSITASAAKGVIAGLGFNSYVLGVHALELVHTGA